MEKIGFIGSVILAVILFAWFIVFCLCVRVLLSVAWIWVTERVESWQSRKELKKGM